MVIAEKMRFDLTPKFEIDNLKEIYKNMSEKYINSRVILKHDTVENWEKAVNFIP